MMQIEKVTDLDESMILGYFESIRCTYLTKLLFIISFANKDCTGIDPSKIPKDAIATAENLIEDPVVYKALRQGNEEPFLNFRDDMDTNLLTSSWNVFEQIIKFLSKGNYTLDPTALNLTLLLHKFLTMEPSKSTAVGI